MVITSTDICSNFVEIRNNELVPIVDFFVDVDRWKVRYLKVCLNRKSKFAARAISPVFLKPPVEKVKKGIFFKLGIPKREIEKSPPISSDQNSITRSFEYLYHSHFKVPTYWTELPGSWVEQPYSFCSRSSDLRGRGSGKRLNRPAANFQTKVFSCQSLKDYDVWIKGVHMGAVVDLVLDERTWDIEYFLVRQGKGQSRLILPSIAITRFLGTKKEIHFELNAGRLPRFDHYSGIHSLSPDVLSLAELCAEEEETSGKKASSVYG